MNWEALKAKVQRLKEQHSDNLEPMNNQLILNLKMTSEQYRNEIDRVHEHITSMLDVTEKEIVERGINREVVLRFGQDTERIQHNLEIRKAKANAHAKEGKSQLILKFKKYIEGKHIDDIRRELQEGKDPQIEVCRQPVRKELEQSYETELNETLRIKNFQEILSSFRYIFDEGEMPQVDRDLHPSQKKYDTEVRVRQFQSLAKDPQRPDCITKETLYNFLTSYKYTMVFYNIDPMTIREEVDYLQTDTKGLLTLQQFHQFLTQSRQTVDYEKYLGIAKQTVTVSLDPTFVGDQVTWNIVDRIFQQINYFGDTEISQQQLGRKLGEQLGRFKLIQKPAVFLPKINRHIYFYQILFQIQNSIQVRIWTITSLKEYLLNYKPLRVGDRYDLLQKLIIIGRCPNEKIVLLRKQPYELVKRIYQACEKFQRVFIMKKHFVDRLISNQLFKELQSIKVRQEPSWGIEQEDFKQIVERLSLQADDFISFDELLDFFSQGGRPKHLFNIMHEKLFNKNIKAPMDDSFLCQQHTSRQHHGKNSSKRNEVVTPTIEKIKKKFLNQNVTVPNPFKLTRTEPKPKSKQPDPAPQTFQFKHKPVPDVCKSANLYTHMVNEQNRKRQMRHNELKHQNRMQRVKPFDLSKSRGQTRVQPQIQPFVFKANPVPQSTLIPKYEQIQRQKERKRQMLRQQAENNLKMPQAVKNMLVREYEFRQRRKKKPIKQEETRRSPQVKPVPNFKKLHHQFEETLNQRKREYKPTSPVRMALLQRPACSRRHSLDDSSGSPDSRQKRNSRGRSRVKEDVSIKRVKSATRQGGPGPQVKTSPLRQGPGQSAASEQGFWFGWGR